MGEGGRGTPLGGHARSRHCRPGARTPTPKMRARAPLRCIDPPGSMAMAHPAPGYTKTVVAERRRWCRFLGARGRGAAATEVGTTWCVRPIVVCRAVRAHGAGVSGISTVRSLYPFCVMGPKRGAGCRTKQKLFLWLFFRISLLKFHDRKKYRIDNLRAPKKSLSSKVR